MFLSVRNLVKKLKNLDFATADANGLVLLLVALVAGGLEAGVVPLDDEEGGEEENDGANDKKKAKGHSLESGPTRLLGRNCIRSVDHVAQGPAQLGPIDSIHELDLPPGGAIEAVDFEERLADVVQLEAVEVDVGGLHDLRLSLGTFGDFRPGRPAESLRVRQVALVVDLVVGEVEDLVGVSISD